MAISMYKRGKMENENPQNMNVEVEAPASTTETSATTTLDNSSNTNADVVETKTNDSENNVDTNGGTRREYTDLEKAQYSFHKQFARQQKKFDKQIAEMKQFYENQLNERLPKPAPKTRADFPYDDEYVKYLVGEQMNQFMNQKMMEYNRQMEAQQKLAAEEQMLREKAERNIMRMLPDETERNAWKATVKQAVNNGLGERLDAAENKAIADFILYSPIGPKALYELATNKQLADEILDEDLSETEKKYMLDELVYNVMAKPTTNVNVNPQPVQAPKAVGRPGVGATPIKKPWDSKEGLLRLAGVK